VNGTRALLMSARRGDHVVVTFDVPDGCENRMTFSSFVAPSPALDGSHLSQQAVYSRQSRVFGAGTHSLEIDVFAFPGSTVPDCAGVPVPVPLVSKRRDDHAIVAFAAASPGAPCDGSRTSGGKPCDGCVGHADDKNPPGQFPNDPNAGYECDRNHGIGQGNPAHSPCENFQVDFSYAPAHGGVRHLVAGLFCDRAKATCYTTDRTGTGAVHGV
jgi:hypothetical protein